MGHTEQRPDAVVVGGGVIGLASAWRCAARGLRVTVVDPDPGRGASWAAAGMLAPVSEVAYGEEDLLALSLASARAYPEFVADLEEATGTAVGYRTGGTLCVARDTDDLKVLEDLRGYQERLGLEVERLRRRACREREPLLSPSVRGGLMASGDHAVDNRLLVEALRLAVEKDDRLTMIRDRVARVVVGDGRVRGVELAAGGRIEAPAVVIAAGAWSGGIDGIPAPARPPVRPVRGELLYLRDRGRDPGPVGGSGEPFLTHNLRGVVAGSSVYIVPRGDGRYVVGATVEEQGFDTSVTAGGVWRLLRDARELLPAVTELDVIELVAGLRPGSPDNAPILGPTPVEGLVLATGHYRNGILLTPVTADAVAAFLTGGRLPEVAAPFTLKRFQEAT